MAGSAKIAVVGANCKFIICVFAARSEMIP
jgi:hypothetical protein